MMFQVPTLSGSLPPPTLTTHAAAAYANQISAGRPIPRCSPTTVAKAKKVATMLEKMMVASQTDSSRDSLSARMAAVNRILRFGSVLGGSFNGMRNSSEERMSRATQGKK